MLISKLFEDLSMTLICINFDKICIKKSRSST